MKRHGYIDSLLLYTALSAEGTVTSTLIVVADLVKLICGKDKPHLKRCCPHN
jgi:hypothetical protein